jgi:integrase
MRRWRVSRRVAGPNPGAITIVERWMEMRKRPGVSARASLFATLEGKRFNPSCIRTLLPRLAAKTGSTSSSTPHALRHSHAFELMMVYGRQVRSGCVSTTPRGFAHWAGIEKTRTPISPSSSRLMAEERNLPVPLG